jgi:hypothetical protein
MLEQFSREWLGIPQRRPHPQGEAISSEVGGQVKNNTPQRRPHQEDEAIRQSRHTAMPFHTLNEGPTRKIRRSEAICPH